MRLILQGMIAVAIIGGLLFLSRRLANWWVSAKLAQQRAERGETEIRIVWRQGE